MRARLRPPPKTDRLIFEDEAKPYLEGSEKMIGVWTDGVCLSTEADPAMFTELSLIPGRTYRVTVELLPETPKKDSK